MQEKMLCLLVGASGEQEAAEAAEAADWAFLSASTLLRKEAASGSALGLELQACANEGREAPAAAVIGVLAKALNTTTTMTGALVSGFPRTAAELAELEAAVQRRADAALVLAGGSDDAAAAPLAAALEAAGRATYVAGAADITAALFSAAAPSAPETRSPARRPLVLCGPSGVGKGTLIARLMAEHGDRFGFSVSHTTRGARPGEADGVHYHFTTRAEMEAGVSAGAFLEHADVHGNMYGTSGAAVRAVAAAGKVCVLDIDVQGARQVRASTLGGDCLYVFVAPPSMAELERRLRGRGTEAEDKVLKRLAAAAGELDASREPGLFHHVIVNDDLDAAYAALLAAVEQHAPGTLPAAAAVAAAVAAEEPAGAAPATPARAAAPAAAAAPTASPAPAPTAAVDDDAPPPPTSPDLLDFGFGASGGGAAAAAAMLPAAGKGVPVRSYLDAAVVPALREGLKALNAARPDDPLQFLADFLVARKAGAVPPVPAPAAAAVTAA